MLFSSITFLYYFLPITLLLYVLVPNAYKNSLLFLASFLFYVWGEPKYGFLMLGSILVGYLGGRCIERVQNKWILYVFVGLQLSLLGIFKYTDFLISTVNQMTSLDLDLLYLALPVGISFYSFQIISYLVDVSRKDLEAERNMIDFGAYVTMFPQLIAGPIVRYDSIKLQMKERKIGLVQISEGAIVFLLGLAKKVLLADQLGEAIILLESVTGTGSLTAWVVALCYMLQIYLDFSGYSDMAIGLGKMLGFEFPMNFNYPFISRSITEFWRRWHISLSTFFRDYVYIPLGGSRCSKKRFALHLLIVWFLSGLWHGASWNFVLWGLYFGFFLLIEKLWLQTCLNRLGKAVGHVYTILVVCISFVLFRFESLEEVGTRILQMFSFQGEGNPAIYYELRNMIFLLVLAVLASLPVKHFIKIKSSKLSLVLKCGFVIVTMTLVTMYILHSSVHPFLYFRF